MLLEEPLPAPGQGAETGPLAEALDDIQPLLLGAFRGSEEEITHRLQRHLERVRTSPPVLDLGCGRGELLWLLREAGVEATGVEADPALVQGALRRGLAVVEGDVLEVLEQQPAGSWGAVTAVHVFEHLSPARMLSVLAEVRRVLRPGGVLVVECPNPLTLRVGGSLYWMDPTHQHPLLPETLELYLGNSGFEGLERVLLHPFPDDQRLPAIELDDALEKAPAVAELHAQLRRFRDALDELLNGPRDFVVTACKPDDEARG